MSEQPHTRESLAADVRAWQAAGNTIEVVPFGEHARDYGADTAEKRKAREAGKRGGEARAARWNGSI